MRSDGALAVAVVVVAVVVVAVNQVVPRHVLNVWVCGWLDGCLGKCVWGWVDAVREVGVGARAVVELVLLVVVVVAVVLRVVVAAAGAVVEAKRQTRCAFKVVGRWVVSGGVGKGEPDALFERAGGRAACWVVWLLVGWLGGRVGGRVGALRNGGDGAHFVFVVALELVVVVAVEVLLLLLPLTMLMAAAHIYARCHQRTCTQSTHTHVNKLYYNLKRVTRIRKQHHTLQIHVGRTCNIVHGNLHSC